MEFYLTSFLLDLLVAALELWPPAVAAEPTKKYRCEAYCYYRLQSGAIARERTITENHDLHKAWDHLQTVCNRKDETGHPAEVQFHPDNWDNNSDEPEFLEATPELVCS